MAFNMRLFSIDFETGMILGMIAKREQWDCISSRRLYLGHEITRGVRVWGSELSMEQSQHNACMRSYREGGVDGIPPFLAVGDSWQRGGWMISYQLQYIDVASLILCSRIEVWLCDFCQTSRFQ